MNEALRKWVDSKRGNAQRLADGVCLTQPTISKWINPKESVAIRIEYAEKVMRTTGLMAKDIYPEHYKLFSSDAYKDGIIDAQNKAHEKTILIRERLDLIESLRKEIYELLADS